MQKTAELKEYKWRRREIENYLALPETLLAWAEGSAEEVAPGPLFTLAEQERRIAVMSECIEDFVPRAAMRDRSDKWWSETKASDDFLDRLFDEFFKKLGLPNLMMKTHYHVLARYVPAAQIDPEIARVLDSIVDVSAAARPLAADN